MPKENFPRRGRQTVGVVTPIRPDDEAASIEYEQSLLGGIILCNAAWPDVSPIVSEQDFSQHGHRLIFRAMAALFERKRAADIVTLADALEQAGVLQETGDWAYLGLLVENTPSAVNVRDYARIVRRKSLERRRLAALAKGDHHQAAAITAAIDALEATSKAALLLPTIDDILALPVNPDWLIKNWLERRQTGVLFGESQAYKTLAGIDMGCCIATGTLWRGHPVKQGGVLFIVGEGAGSGLRRRFRAWEIANKVSLKGCPIFFVESPTTLPNDMERLTSEITATLAHYKWKLEITFLDTLSRTISGSERDSKDFCAYQHAIDVLKERFDCAAMFLHHVGHADKGRERGASEIGSNTDVRLLMEILSDETRKLTPLKVKEAEKAAPLFFLLSVVELGQTDEDGDEITSVVLTQRQDYQPPEKELPPTQREAMALAILAKLLETETHADGVLIAHVWRPAVLTALRASEPDSPRKTVEKAWLRTITGLQRKHLVILTGITDTRAKLP